MLYKHLPAHLLLHNHLKPLPMHPPILVYFPFQERHFPVPNFADQTLYFLLESHFDGVGHALVGVIGEGVLARLVKLDEVGDEVGVEGRLAQEVGGYLVFYFVLILIHLFLRSYHLLRTRVQFFHHVRKLLRVVLIVHLYRSLKNDQLVESVRDRLRPLNLQSFDLLYQLSHFLRVFAQMVVCPFDLDLIVLGLQLGDLQFLVHLVKTALLHGLVAFVRLMHLD